MLLFQHCVLYEDLYSAIRKGNTGRIERVVDLLCPLFFGAGKSNYGREVLELMLDRQVMWTPEMRGYWLENVVLNMSEKAGKFMGIDEVNKYLVRELKDRFVNLGVFVVFAEKFPR